MLAIWRHELLTMTYPCKKQGNIGQFDSSRFKLPALLFASLFFLFSSLSHSATPANTQITNVVTATFGLGSPIQVQANTSFTTDTNSPSFINFMRIDNVNGAGVAAAIPPASCSIAGNLSGPFSNFPLTDVNGNTVSGNTMNVTEPIAFTAGEPILLRVEDTDQNLDGLVTETLSVTITSSAGDTEVVELFETGPSSAEFIGAIQSNENTAIQNNCALEVGPNSELTVTYTDLDDQTDTVSTTVLVDPFGVVFDSTTGSPIDNIVVTLIDDATGLPATVFSPNGIDIWPSTVLTGQDVTDSAGTVFTAGSGEYRFPLVASGNYRLEVTPNADLTFPSLVSDADLQLLPGGPYVLSDGSRGNAFFVPPGPAVQIDIPLDPIGQALTLIKTASENDASIGDFIAYDISASSNLTSQPLLDVELVDALPLGFRFQEDSMRLNGVAIEPIVAPDGRTLSIPAGTINAGETISIRYIVEVTAGSPIGEAVNQIQSVNSGQGSNLASATVNITNALFSDNSFLVGRMIVAECGATGTDLPGLPNVRLYLDDGKYVESDADGRWSVPELDPGTHAVRIDETTINSNYRLLDCTDNTRKAGSINSRFVQVTEGALWVEDFYFEQIEDSDIAIRSIEEETLALLRVSEDIDQMPEFDEVWLETADAGNQILWPENNFVARQRAISIAVKHSGELQPSAFLNDVEVNPLNFRGRTTHPNTNDVVSTWKGVDIPAGTSVLDIRLIDSNGAVAESFKQEIHFSGAPHRAEVVPELSRLVADGQTPPLVAVRLIDSQGNAVRPGVSGQYFVDSPHEAWQEANRRLEQTFISENSEVPTYTVSEDGIAYLPITPTNVSGRLQITLPLLDQREKEIDVWLTADARDWIMVGFVEGTAAHSNLSGNLESLSELDVADNFDSDGEIRFFAKGRVRGDYLLTIAYDSGKDTSDQPSELLERIDPDEYYNVYGDESQLINETPSSEKLYLKLERGQFYALFGDYQTNLSVTELTRYNRSLTGLKSEFRTDHIEANLFASDIALANVRDEIRGNGTSGRFFLSNTDVVENSELITIEVRDRFETGEILSRTSLNRFRDYEIDYDEGSINFASPIASRDEDFNPIFIVVNYETASDASASITGGGRVAVSTKSDDIEIGATYVREGNDGLEGELAGIDSRFQLSEEIELRAEAASTDTETDGSANAWSIEANQQSGRLTSRVYARRVEDGFGLAQQNASEQGTQKLGLTLNWDIQDNLELEANITQNRSLEQDARNRQASIAARYNRSIYSVQIGYRWANDRNETNEGTSDLLTSRLTVQPLERLTASVGAEVAPTGSDDSITFPSRYTLGLEWLVTNKSSFFVEQEITSGGNDTESTRVGVRTLLWKDAEINVGVNRSLQDDNGGLSTTAGFVQRLKLSDSWTADVSLDRGQTLNSVSPTSGINTASPLSSGPGGDDFTAASVGADWRGDQYFWSNRIEFRESVSSDTRNLESGVLRQLQNGKSVLGSLNWSEAESGTADTSRDNFTVSLGHANRINPAWTTLNRLDLDFENTDDSNTNIRSRSLIANNNLNYNGWAKSQISLQYAGKYDLTNIDDQEFSGYTDLLGIQYRRDINASWDLGLRAATLGSYNSDNRQYALGASVGWSPISDTWLELGYNIDGFNDDDFAQSEYTAKGVSFSIRHKFNENSFGQFYRQFFVKEPRSPSTANTQKLSDPAPVPTPPSAPAAPTPLATPIRVEELPAIEVPDIIIDNSNTRDSAISIPPVESSASYITKSTDACAIQDEVTVVQLASFLNTDQASDFLVDIIEEENEFIEYYYREAEDVTYYRTNIGPFAKTKSELKDIADQLNEKYDINTWVKYKHCKDLRIL